jgi:hypothetical protein
MASEKRKRKCKIEEVKKISSKSNKMTDNPKKTSFWFVERLAVLSNKKGKQNR